MKDKKQPTKPVDNFAGPGSTADHIKQNRKKKQKELDRIMGK